MFIGNCKFIILRPYVPSTSLLLATSLELVVSDEFGYTIFNKFKNKILKLYNE